MCSIDVCLSRQKSISSHHHYNLVNIYAALDCILLNVLTRIANNETHKTDVRYLLVIMWFLKFRLQCFAKQDLLKTLYGFVTLYTAYTETLFYNLFPKIIYRQILS